MNLKHLTSFIKKSYYVKMLIFYSTFTVGVIVLSFVFSIKLFGNGFEKEVNESNKRLLTQVQIYTDKYLLEKINSIISENFLYVKSNSILLNFYGDKNPRSNNSILEVYNSISNISVNYDFIDSICLYRSYSNTIVSTEEGVIFNASPDSERHIALYIDYIKRLLPENQTKYWLSPLENNDFYNTSPIITYVQSIPIYSPNKSCDGLFIININQSLLFKSINKIYGHDGELMVIDDEGRLFAHSDSSKLREKIKSAGYLENVLGSNEGFLTTTINGTSYGITWVKSSSNNWRYISVVPMKALTQRAVAVKQVVLIILAFVLFFSFIGLNLITSRLYKPLKTLTKKVSENFNIVNKDENELNYINNVFSHLANKVDDMGATIKNNQEIIKYKAVIDILYGNMHDETEIQNRLNLLETPIESNFYAVIIFEIDSQVTLKASAEQLEYISAKSNILVNSYLSGKCNYITICHPSNCITAIVGFDSADPTCINLNKLIKTLENELGINFNINISKPSKLLTQLSKLFISTRDQLKYSYIYNYGNIFTYSILDKYESNNTGLDPNLLIQMESLLKSCKIDKLKVLIEEQISFIKTKGLSYNYTQSLLLQILRIISKVCHEQGLTSDKLERARLVSTFSSITDLNTCISWIYSVIDLYNENTNRRNISIDSDFINNVIAYISNNVDKQISLNSVADEFKISPSYLSRLFKECLGTNFLEYVSNKKLEKACELLVGQNDMNISDIAQTLGYVTPAYFSRIFKEKYGLTPALYRKKTLSEYRAN